MFSPYQGRFITLDPTFFDAGDVNLYRGLENNPGNLLDPDGLQAKNQNEWFKGISVSSKFNNGKYTPSADLNLQIATFTKEHANQHPDTAFTFEIKVFRRNYEGNLFGDTCERDKEGDLKQNFMGYVYNSFNYKVTLNDKNKTKLSIYIVWQELDHLRYTCFSDALKLGGPRRPKDGAGIGKPFETLDSKYFVINWVDATTILHSGMFKQIKMPAELHVDDIVAIYAIPQGKEPILIHAMPIIKVPNVKK